MLLKSKLGSLTFIKFCDSPPAKTYSKCCLTNGKAFKTSSILSSAILDAISLVISANPSAVSSYSSSASYPNFSKISETTVSETSSSTSSSSTSSSGSSTCSSSTLSSISSNSGVGSSFTTSCSSSTGASTSAVASGTFMPSPAITSSKVMSSNCILSFGSIIYCF